MLLLCQYAYNFVRIIIFMIIIRTYLLLYIWSKMLSASRDSLLKPPKTTSPQKLFPSFCITLYKKYLWRTELILQNVCSSLIQLPAALLTIQPITYSNFRRILYIQGSGSIFIKIIYRTRFLREHVKKTYILRWTFR